MSLNDIMSKNLIVCDINDNISHISFVMKDNDIGFIPIVDKNKIVGVITDRDICTKCISNSLISNSVSQYMSKNIISADASESILVVLNLMRDNKVKRVLISDNNKCIGVVSISDFLIIDEYRDYVYNVLRSIFSINPNVHKYETEIDEFYL